ncbi:protein prkA, partial [Planococcus sp. SIMBA_143]
EKIYEKMINESDVSNVHVAPHTLRVAAMFTILTRLKEPKRGDIDLIKKMRLYDGENVEGFNSADVDEMKKEYQDEGMSGIDPRYV